MAFPGSFTFKFSAKSVLGRGGQVPQKDYLPVHFQRPRVSKNGNSRLYIYMTGVLTSKEPMLPQRAPPILDINMKSEQYKVRVYLNVTTWAIIKSKVHFTLFFLWYFMQSIYCACHLTMWAEMLSANSNSNN